MKGGDTFVLEMGEQIKLLDAARAHPPVGLVPRRTSPSAFVGLRPGEKLSEEADRQGRDREILAPEGVLRVQLSTAPAVARRSRASVAGYWSRQLADAGDDAAAIAALAELAPIVPVSWRRANDGLARTWRRG